MSKFDIHKNKPLPSDEEINKYKNFGKVVKKSQLYDYRKATKPLYKNMKVMGVVVAIVAVMLILMFESDDEEQNTVKGTKDSVRISTDTINKQSAPQPADSVKPVSHSSSSTQTGNITSAHTASTDTVAAIETDVTDVSDETVYKTVSTSASFPGGETALSSFLTKNINYPYNAVANPFSGKVEATMVVEKSGKITTVSILNSPNAAITAEINRVIKLMPDWTPAKKGSQIVRSQITVAFPFIYREE